ncbi:MAG: hypothetical protein ACC641_10350 [Acidiferrobacterales bacterium]
MPVKRLMMALAILIALPAHAEEVPDVEMLEYLGSWETASGEYIDPTELTAEDLEQESKESNEK